MGGSSPLARGKSCAAPRRVARPGFIPTRAGKIHTLTGYGPLGAVHPHSRGENSWSTTRKAWPGGSSPLARGKFVPNQLWKLREWFIPTRAGKIPWAYIPIGPDGVHPHSRGENCYAAVMEIPQEGSSPLARGKCAAGCGQRGRAGFIPTRAGKIGVLSRREARWGVHPHSRGENARPHTWKTVLSGSSPLARGKFARNAPERRPPRFIPTRAGKMVPAVSASQLNTVHPHSRGENIYGQPKTGKTTGSSPLARGKSLRCAVWGQHERFIPTRAGKIPGTGDQKPGITVHPHSRGENLHHPCH